MTIDICLMKYFWSVLVTVLKSAHIEKINISHKQDFSSFSIIKRNYPCKNKVSLLPYIAARGTMLCWTLKLKDVLNKQIISASVPEAAVLI